MACKFNATTKQWAKKRVNIIGHQYKRPCSVLSFGFNDGPQFIQKHKVKLFLFQRDEKELILDWLQYHSFIFGFKNIILIDNISQNPEVCKIISLFQYCGVNIIEEEYFKHKSNALTTRMEMLSPKSESFIAPIHLEDFTNEFILSPPLHELDDLSISKDNFLVPIDSDEFITIPQLHELSIDEFELKEKILETFQSLPIDGRKYKFIYYEIFYSIKQCINFMEIHNDTIRRVMADAYLSDWEIPDVRAKTFYYSKGFMETDQGNHFGLVKHDKGIKNLRVPANQISYYYYIHSNLSLYHYERGSYDAFLYKNLRAAKAYGYNSSTDCGMVGSGVHYCRMAKLCEKRDNVSAHEYMKITCRDFKTFTASNFKDIFYRNALSLYEVLYKSYQRSYWERLFDNLYI